MARHVVMLHGWSATSKSMGELAAFVASLGRKTHDVHLGDYLSMQDDVRVEDAAKRMQAVLKDLLAAGTLKAPFDLIVHSTGALVARRWLVRFFPDGDAPVRNLVMLAPANFGSKLAKLGRSMAARVYKTLFGDAKGFETGTEMLHALELASPFQWDLAQADLLAPPGAAAASSVYSETGVRPFVIAGVQPLSDMPHFASEPGSDSTVRVASANLDALGFTIDFTGPPSRVGEPLITRWPSRHGMSFPFAAVADRDHLSILYPMNGESGAVRKKRESAAVQGSPMRGQLAALIKQALETETPAQYRAAADLWRQVSELTAGLAINDPGRVALFGRDEPGAVWFHQYYTVIVRARDDHGGPVGDYFVSFVSRPSGGPQLAANARWTLEDDAFHQKVLRHVHANTRRPDLRCFHIDRNALFEDFYPRIRGDRPEALYAMFTAETRGDKVAFFTKDQKEGRGLVKLHDQANPEERRLERWKTHLVDVIIPRVPDDDVFAAAPFG